MNHEGFLCISQLEGCKQGANQNLIVFNGRREQKKNHTILHASSNIKIMLHIKDAKT